MADQNTLPTDVFDVTQYISEAIPVWAMKNPGVYSSAMAKDVSKEVDMTSGGKSVSIPTIDFLDADGNQAEFKAFTPGGTNDTVGGKLDVVEVPLKEQYLSLLVNGTSLEQAWKSGKTGESIIDHFITSCGAKMASRIDKVLIEEIIASGQRYFRKSTDTKIANALLSSRALFGDKQAAARNLVINGLGNKTLIEDHLDAAATGASVLLTGQLTNYLGCNVILSDNIADNHAIIGLDESIKYVIKNASMSVVKERNKNYIYEVYFSIAAYIPTPYGMKGVVYADIGTPPAVLKTTLTPAAAVTAGAKWSIDGGTTWLDSAASANVTGNTATIKFKPTTGYATPADKVLTNLQNGATTAVSQAYTAS